MKRIISSLVLALRIFINILLSRMNCSLRLLRICPESGGDIGITQWVLPEAWDLVTSYLAKYALLLGGSPTTFRNTSQSCHSWGNDPLCFKRSPLRIE